MMTPSTQGSQTVVVCTVNASKLVLQTSHCLVQIEAYRNSVQIRHQGYFVRQTGEVKPSLMQEEREYSSQASVSITVGGRQNRG